MKKHENLAATAPSFRSALLAGAVGFGLLTTPAAGAVLDDDSAAWTPASSERLIKLPTNYLKKAINQDFAKSSLAAALGDTREKLKLKVGTLEDLREAIHRSDGDLKIELNHQFLAEKRAYLELVAQHQTLRRKQAEAKIRLYERLLGKMKRSEQQQTPQRVALIEKQDQARARFESSLARVDTKLFRSTLTSESRYAQQYAKNVAAIEKLVHAVNAHPMNLGSEQGGALTKNDFIHQLITENESDLAVLDQERTVLGYMAKLISLDALALTEAVDSGNLNQAPTDPQESGLTIAVDYFVTQ